MKKKILLITVGLLILAAFWFGAAKLSEARNSYRNLDFFTLWLGGHLAAQGQNMYSEALWVGGHAIYNSTWVENPFFVYPYPTALLFIPLGMLPIEIASTVWVFLSFCMVAASLWFLLSMWDSQKRIIYLVPVLAGTILFRPAFLTILHGQLDGLLLFILSLSIYFSSRGNQKGICFLLPLLLIKPNLGGPILAIYGLWLLIHRYWKAVAHILLESLAIYLLPLFSFPGWIKEFINTSLYKSADQNLFPNLRGLSGLVCSEKAACFEPLWVILSLLVVLGLLYWMLQKKQQLNSTEVIALGICVTLLITPYLRAYDLILLLVPVVMILGKISMRMVRFSLVSGIYLLFCFFSLALLFLATTLEHDIFSILLTIIATTALVWGTLQQPGRAMDWKEIHEQPERKNGRP